MEGVSSQHDPDRVFDTREDAEAVRDGLNQKPPEPGYSPWYLGGLPEGKFIVIRARGIMAEDLDQDVRSYEEALRAAVERSASNHDHWRDSEGIRIERVSLDGAYPDSNLVVLFRAVRSLTTSYGQPQGDCLFGIRWPIWPAEYDDPEAAARAHDVYFGEHLGTEPAADLRLRGAKPCDPDQVNWLE
jgi:hypothetical protein